MILLEIPDPSTNILNYVLFSLVGLLITVVGGMVYLLRTKYAGKQPTGNGSSHKPFPDDPAFYWYRMKQEVTDPLTNIMKEVVFVLRELRDQSIEEKGALRERDRLLEK